jgi:hypothetical protein
MSQGLQFGWAGRVASGTCATPECRRRDGDASSALHVDGDQDAVRRRAVLERTPRRLKKYWFPRRTALARTWHTSPFSWKKWMTAPGSTRCPVASEAHFGHVYLKRRFTARRTARDSIAEGS